GIYMNQPTDFLRAHLWKVLTLIFAFSLIPAATAEDAVITEIYTDGAELVVIAQVPPGYKKLTLESKTRIERRSWEPRAVLHVDPAGGTVTFRIPASEQLEVLRVKGEQDDLLPGLFFSGKTSFKGSAVSGGGGGSTGGASGGATG